MHIAMLLTLLTIVFPNLIIFPISFLQPENGIIDNFINEGNLNFLPD